MSTIEAPSGYHHIRNLIENGEFEKASIEELQFFSVLLSRSNAGNYFW